MRIDRPSGNFDRATEIYTGLKQALYVNTDHAFAFLLTLQYLGGIVLAFWIAPLKWEADKASTHPHVFAAVFLGALFSLFPAAWAMAYPGQKFTRHLIAVCQMLTASLIIHLTGGRIESHFHIFGSLAFLCFYRDPWVLITASAITAADHFFRGIYWPESLYGETIVASWRWLEHAGWVIFEDCFLIYSCLRSSSELRGIASRQADLERVNRYIEAEVDARTKELRESHLMLESERARTMDSAKMVALGEMAAGIAHEINNPVAAIQMNASEIEDISGDPTPDVLRMKELAELIGKSTSRVTKIVASLRSLARDAHADPFETVPLEKVISETLALCQERFRARGVTLYAPDVGTDISLRCRSGEVAQVLLNLLQNALDAAEESEGRWVRVEVRATGEDVQIVVVDSGPGVPSTVREKIFQPFFTTKDVGRGTGLGLSISTRIMKAHGGSLELDTGGGATRFRLKFPKEAS
jgi:two-component system sensor histidine kinase HydH